MLRRIALLVLWCIAAGALAPSAHVVTSDRRDGKHIASLARQGPLVEMRTSRRDRVGGSQRIHSAVWLHASADRPVGYTIAARPAHRSRSVATLPSYLLATHLSL
ncbi:MAG: hypothetical protein M3P13_05180 [Acidobacteriota bacterium]|nr:hypothetical protein [Acidobacteriota bacterium]